MKTLIVVLSLFALNISAPAIAGTTPIQAALTHPAVQKVLDQKTLQGYEMSEIVNWHAYSYYNPNNEPRSLMTVYLHNIKLKETRYFYVSYPDNDFSKDPIIQDPFSNR